MDPIIGSLAIIGLVALWVLIRLNDKPRPVSLSDMSDRDWSKLKFREAEQFYGGSGITGVAGRWN